MRSSVMMPQRKNFDAEVFKDGGTVVGGVIGGVLGGPGGAVEGGLLGRGVGGVAGGIVSPDRPGPAPVGGGQVAAPGRAQQPGVLDTAAGAAGAYQGASKFGSIGSSSDAGNATGNIPQQSSPMQRRYDQMQQSEDLAAADAALAKAPPEYQQQYGPAIANARYLDKQRRGMA